jgi:hypothetical protein
VVDDALERAVLGEARDDAVRRRDERRERIDAEVVDRARGSTGSVGAPRSSIW